MMQRAAARLDTGQYVRIFKGNGIGQAKAQGLAAMIERGGVITGYAAGIGILGHAVAKSNEELKILIAKAPTILGPGFFVPGRNHEIIKCCLIMDFKLVGLQTYDYW